MPFTDQGQVTMRTLHILPFDSDRKRMSVIVENPITHEIILYCKGADSAIFTNLKERTPGKLNLQQCCGYIVRYTHFGIIVSLEFVDFVTG